MGIKRRTPVPGVWDYVKCLAAAFLIPFIGPIWVIVKGIIRLVTKNITFFEYAATPTYKSDKRYRSGYRYNGDSYKRVKDKSSIDVCSKSDVIYFRVNAAIYILIGIGALVAQFTWSNNQEKEKEVLEKMVHWTKIEEINDSTGVVSSCDILFPRTSDGVSNKFALVSEGGSTLLYRTGLTNLDLTEKFDYKEPLEYKGKLRVTHDEKDQEYKVYSVDERRECLLLGEKVKLQVYEAYTIKDLRYLKYDFLVIRAEGKEYAFDLRVSGW